MEAEESLFYKCGSVQEMAAVGGEPGPAEIMCFGGLRGLRSGEGLPGARGPELACCRERVLAACSFIIKNSMDACHRRGRGLYKSE